MALGRGKDTLTLRSPQHGSREGDRDPQELPNMAPERVTRNPQELLSLQGSVGGQGPSGAPNMTWMGTGTLTLRQFPQHGSGEGCLFREECCRVWGPGLS